MRREYIVVVFLVLFVGLLSCRKEMPIVASTQTDVADAWEGEVKGFFLLNEGNMGSNKATLDYFDYTTGVYNKNIFAERNPNVVMELGDVGNDIKIYGDKLYAVINCSNIVEVMDVTTAEHITQVSVPNCRFLTFDEGYAYVSSYAGPVQIDPSSRLGYVAKIDTATMTIVDTCTVGYQPEEMVISGGKLYVANSGGYNPANYDNRVSVIDLQSFTVIDEIEVEINLCRMLLDYQGQIWVSSRGDYYDVASNTYVIDPSTNKVTDTLDVACSAMALYGDSLYVFGTEWSYLTQSSSVSYAVINTETKEVLTRSFITDGSETDIEVPYALAVNPVSGDIFIGDAKNYVTPGKLFCYSSSGKLKWSVTTGDIPASIAFTNRELEEL